MKKKIIYLLTLCLMGLSFSCTNHERIEAMRKREMYFELPTPEQEEAHKNFRLTAKVSNSSQKLKQQIVKFVKNFEKHQTEDEKCELLPKTEYYLSREDRDTIFIDCTVNIRSSSGAGYLEFIYRETAVYYLVKVTKNQIDLKIFLSGMLPQYEDGKIENLTKQIEFVQIEDFAKKHFYLLVDYLKN
ncbi:putative lipoprotein [Leptospira santarosai str. CBC1416]|uniref:Putative lipoprotein n=1 Tax=Leptospira santarosai str. CBC1416 TaxID=1193059 RepID=M6VEY8_9LEPT|nr:putative lipoprotein [Leptospira santarosai str. CBC1416]